MTQLNVMESFFSVEVQSKTFLLSEKQVAETMRAGIQFVQYANHDMKISRAPCPRIKS